MAGPSTEVIFLKILDLPSYRDRNPNLESDSRAKCYHSHVVVCCVVAELNGMTYPSGCLQCGRLQLGSHVKMGSCK